MLTCDISIRAIPTGNGYNESGEERRRCQNAVYRLSLERYTFTLLVATKASLRHPDCIHVNENRDSVFSEMRRAIDQLHYVVKDGFTIAGCIVQDRYTRHYSIPWSSGCTATNTLRVFARTVEHARPKLRKATAHKDISTAPSVIRDEESMGERRELMRSNSERDRHMTNHRLKNRKLAYRDHGNSVDYHSSNSGGSGTGNGFRSTCRSFTIGLGGLSAATAAHSHLWLFRFSHFSQAAAVK